MPAAPEILSPPHLPSPLTLPLTLNCPLQVAEEPYRNATSVVELYRNAKASAGRSRSYSSAMEAFFHAIPGVGESCAKTVSKVRSERVRRGGGRG